MVGGGRGHRSQSRPVWAPGSRPSLHCPSATSPVSMQLTQKNNEQQQKRPKGAEGRGAGEEEAAAPASPRAQGELCVDSRPARAPAPGPSTPGLGGRDPEIRSGAGAAPPSTRGPTWALMRGWSGASGERGAGSRQRPQRGGPGPLSSRALRASPAPVSREVGETASSRAGQETEAARGLRGPHSSQAPNWLQS